jgi:hypothetical protein
MKLTIAILLLILALTASLNAGTINGKPMMYADSYMLRAFGAEANYWNPALLSVDRQDFWMPVLNLGFYLANNSLDLEIYNHIMAKGTITEADKVKLLDMIDGKVALDLGAQFTNFGFTMGNIALSSTTHLNAKAAFDEAYLRLLLYGNEEEHYEFTKENNNFSALSYVDLTLGMGDITLPLPKSIPEIKAGWAASLLFGIESMTTQDYLGSFTSNLDGFSFQQDILFKAGGGGAGFKGMLGLVSEPVRNLTTGLTVDNVLGFIKWGIVSENLSYRLEADSLYVADLNEDFYVNEFNREKADYFSTPLAPELRLAALYRLPQVSLSADYVQGLGSSIVTSSTGRLSLGAELLPIPALPLHCGISFGNANYPWRVSYGFGLKVKPFEFGLGVQSFESILPGQNSKGISLATYFMLRM